MSLSILCERVHHVKTTISAIDTALSSCGITFGAVYLSSRALGIALDALTVGVAFQSGALALGIVYSIHLAMFRASMVGWMLLFGMGKGHGNRVLYPHGVQKNIHADVFRTGTFFSWFTRVQFMAASDELLVDNGAFLCIGIITFAALQGSDVLLFGIGFIVEFFSKLNASENNLEKLPIKVSLLMGLQGVLLLGGLVSNFSAFRVSARRRSELLRARGRVTEVCGDEQRSVELNVQQSMQQPLTEETDEIDGGKGSLGCLGEGMCVGGQWDRFVAFCIVCGKIAYVFLITLVFGVGGYFFYAFILYYFVQS